MLDKQKFPKVSQFFGQRKDNICLEKNIGGKGLKPNHFLSGRFLTSVTKWYKLEKWHMVMQDKIQWHEFKHLYPNSLLKFSSTTHWLNDLSWELSQAPIKDEMWEIFIHMDENCY
jgi:hypothetical protein